MSNSYRRYKTTPRKHQHPRMAMPVDIDMAYIDWVDDEKENHEGRENLEANRERISVGMAEQQQSGGAQQSMR